MGYWRSGDGVDCRVLGKSEVGMEKGLGYWGSGDGVQGTSEVRSGDGWVTGEVGMGHWVGYWGGGDGVEYCSRGAQKILYAFNM